MISDDITNILLIGTDERSEDERGRADAIMIATIDEKHGGVKLTSIARDTYVYIPSKKTKEKINHAYSYGGAALLKETIELNLNIQISNYIRINFSSFTEVIDALGGITVNVKQSEISELNKYIPECYTAGNYSGEVKYIQKEGTQRLNGYQALSYARIRKNDSAIKRDERQRAIIQSLLYEFSDANVFELPKIVNTVSKYVTMDIKTSQLLKYAQKVFKMGNFTINQLSFPMSEYSEGKTLSGKGWVLTFDSEKCLEELHKFIFEEDYSNMIKDKLQNIDTENSENLKDLFEDEDEEVVEDVEYEEDDYWDYDIDNSYDDYINNTPEIDNTPDIVEPDLGTEPDVTTPEDNTGEETEEGVTPDDSAIIPDTDIDMMELFTF
jgi:LCP family protein required for cell wall assembly